MEEVAQAWSPKAQRGPACGAEPAAREGRGGACGPCRLADETCLSRL